MISLNFRADHQQKQALSPRFQQAVRLLQMSSMDFAASVRDVLGKNPFLEVEEGDGETDDGDLGTAAEPATGASTAPSDGDERSSDASTPAEGFDGDNDNDRDLWRADGVSSSQHADDSDGSAMNLMAVETSLNTHLHGQLDLLPLTPRELLLARAIVESLDDDGYLRTPLAELTELESLSPPVTLSDMQRALQRVQSLDPCGVAACSVSECLLLQLPTIECPQTRGLAERIVGQHLAALAARDIHGLARSLGESPVRVQAVCDRIRRLDPRPGWRFGTARVAYVVPDVLVRKVRGVWSVQLNPATIPRVRLNQVYAELFKRHRTADDGELAGHLQEARWTVRNVEQRFSTILDVAEAIVKRQQHFLDFGSMAMKPLGLREIAEEVGVHESTVSRVTNNKYMSTPCGVFELKHFFSRAMVTANGSACSGTAIRGLVKDMIDAEAHAAPLSDAEITRQLAQQGLVVARRTVTKYRQLLHIDAVDRRRRHA
ncbi:MAG: RNA polymerase factor sigma-54 [Pseudomonadota bacterium]|nr:RNA polymerase factor sigma-54 [Pseudomonadota bacterium]